MREPVEMYEDNILINTHILKYSHQYNVNRVICVLSTCIFPDDVEYPLTEEKLHSGPPHESNEGYSYAKRMMECQVLDTTTRNTPGNTFV